MTNSDVLGLIDVEQIGPTSFQGVPTRFRLPRVFGGQVAGMAMVAAARTQKEPWPVHSVQSQFLRPGNPDLPIRFDIELSRDGGSFASRNIDAAQGDSRLFSARTSYHRAETGRFDHQLQSPVAPEPGLLPDAAELVRERPDEWPQFYLEWEQLDIRVVPIDPTRPPLASTGSTARSQVWLRASQPLAEDAQAAHSSALTCISDLTFLSTALLPQSIPHSHPDIMLASLDHCLWFHRPFRVDEWLLFDQVSPTASAGRGMCRGEFYDLAGTHVATVIQEGLIRPIRKG